MESCKHEPDFTNANANCRELECCDVDVECQHCGEHGYVVIVADGMKWVWDDEDNSLTPEMLDSPARNTIGCSDQHCPNGNRTTRGRTRGRVPQHLTLVYDGSRGTAARSSPKAK